MDLNLTIYILQRVPAIEELTDISANIMGNTEGASRVLMHELAHIKDQVIKDYQLLPVRYHTAEILCGV